MSLTITLPPDVERALRNRAADDGRDAAELAGELLGRALRGPPTFDEILAPFRREVAASGATDAELDALFHELRDEAWRQSHPAPRP
jgi:plasmid stability protein